MSGDHLNRSNTVQSVYTAKHIDTAKVRDGPFAFNRPEYRRGFQCSTVKYWEVSCKAVFLLQVFFWIVSLSLHLTRPKSIKWVKSFTATEQAALCVTATTSLSGRVKPWIRSISYRGALGKYISYSLRSFLGQKDLERSFRRGVVHQKSRVSTFSKGVWYWERCST